MKCVQRMNVQNHLTTSDICWPLKRVNKHLKEEIGPLKTLKTNVLQRKIISFRLKMMNKVMYLFRKIPKHNRPY